MILFDLICDNEHGFEGWFPDGKVFERQAKKGEVACPICASTRVEKALMAPAVNTSRKSDAARARRNAAEMMKALGEVRKQVEKNCDYVGPEFAEEARRIHYGETEKRDIYGEATRDEAVELADEGVEFGVIPWVEQAEN